MIRKISAVMLLSAGVFAAASYPPWWHQREIIVPEEAVRDYRVVNQGQVKWFAEQAYEELREKAPGPGLAAIRTMIESFPEGGNYRPANLGMLKAVAEPIYDHLIAEGFATAYPWAGGTPADYHLANQGQLKNLFGFDLDAIDTNGNGVPDWFERIYGERIVLAEPSPTQATVIHGAWHADNGVLHALGPNGELRFTLDLPEEGIFALEIEGRSSLPLNEPHFFRLEVTAAGLSCGRGGFLADGTQTGRALFFLPSLPAGPVDVIVRWHNLNVHRRLAITAVRLLTFSSETWRDYRHAYGSELTVLPESSLTSPVCIEGRTRWIERLDVLAGPADLPEAEDSPVAPFRGPSLGWYADVPLVPEGPTRVRITDAESGFAWQGPIEWEPLNLLNSGLDEIMIRAGDSLLLAAYPAGAQEGESLIRIPGQDDIPVAAPQAVPVAFDNPGYYLVEGFWSHNGASGYGALTVRVVFAAFPPERDIWTLRPRDWICRQIPIEAFIDPEVGLVLHELLPRVPRRRVFQLTSLSEGTFAVLARLGDKNGPVLDRAFLYAFDVLAANRSFYNETGEIFADGSRVVEMPISAFDLPEGAMIRLRIIVGGVTFEDGSIEMWISREDLDEYGIFMVRFIMSPERVLAPCYRQEIWKDDMLIGRR